MKTNVVLTGGIGTGKSTALGFLKELGAYIIDADETARGITRKGKPAYAEIVKAFGVEILLPDGVLNRRALGELVFNDRDSLDILNKITHKYIKEEIAAEINSAPDGITVIEAALLSEGGLGELCDYVICVLADKAVRLARITERDGLSEAQAESRIAAQRDDEFYIKNSDYSIINNGSTAELYSALQKILDTIKES